MKRLSFVVSLVLAFALSVWAQTPSSNDTQSGAGSSASQGSQSNSGSMGSQGSMSSPSTSTNSQTSGSQGSMGSSSTSSQGNMGTAEQGKAGKQQKLKGCLESQGGSYMLREKNGKEIGLTGSADLSQYANHEVAVHGDWASGAASSASSTSDMSKSSGSEKQFTVEKVDSLSDTCKGAKKADKDKGASNNTNPSSPQ